MAYHLGIDLGTTYTAAAVARDGRVEAVPLGHRAVSIPSVLYIKGDEFIVGEPANRRATTEPERVAREFKRRVGDPTPILVGGAPLAPEILMARMAKWLVDQVAVTEGEPPASITVTHPANWGTYKLDLLQSAIRHVGLNVERYVPEPVAAATFYASQRPLEPGSVVAVYDLGGGTFDAAVVRRTGDGFEIAGRPEGIERLGGIDFDHAVFSHVLSSIGEATDRLNVDETGMVAAVAQLREECVEAKEALSAETDVDISVLLPGKQTAVRLTRSEFENMIRPAINETIVALRRALASAGVTPEEVSAVLLVGGSSRIPLVAQMVTHDLGRPVAVDARPKDAITLGAALAGWQEATTTPAQPVVTEPDWDVVAPEAVPEAAPPQLVAAAAPPPPGPPPTEAPAPGPFVPTAAQAKSRRTLWLGLAAAAVVVLIGGFFGIRALTADNTPSGIATDTTESAGERIDEGLDTLDDVLGGLGGDDTSEAGDQTITTIPGDDWGPEAEAFIVEGCTNPTSGLPGSPRDTCQCVYDYLAENADFDEYKQADTEFQESGDDFSNFPPVLLDAARECG